jgi:hypothetical protein
MDSSCCLHYRHLLSISSFKILFSKGLVLIAWSFAATIVLSVSFLMSSICSHRYDCSLPTSFPSNLSAFVLIFPCHLFFCLLCYAVFTCLVPQQKFLCIILISIIFIAISLCIHISEVIRCHKMQGKGHNFNKNGKDNIRCNFQRNVFLSDVHDWQSFHII